VIVLFDGLNLLHGSLQGVHHIQERHQQISPASNAKQVQQLVAAAVAASMTLRGQSWDTRLNCLHACLHMVQV
jgi:hypothetical protein